MLLLVVLLLVFALFEGDRMMMFTKDVHHCPDAPLYMNEPTVTQKDLSICKLKLQGKRQPYTFSAFL